jgi:hypothetical protein
MQFLDGIRRSHATMNGICWEIQVRSQSEKYFFHAGQAFSTRKCALKAGMIAKAIFCDIGVSDNCNANTNGLDWGKSSIALYIAHRNIIVRST